MSLLAPRTRRIGHRRISRPAHHAWLAARIASGAGRDARPIAGSNLNRQPPSDSRRTAQRIASDTASGDCFDNQGYWASAHLVAAATLGSSSGTEEAYSAKRAAPRGWLSISMSLIQC